jgi:CheY-like chemotaxis protein
MQRHLVVLVADDDDAIRALLADAVGEEPGLHVLTAADGAQALARCEHTRPAVALVDVNMPGMGGLEVIERLKSHPDLKGVPVVAMSAGHNRDRALAAGADVFVAKPFELEELVAVLYQCLAGRLVGEPERPAQESE